MKQFNQNPFKKTLLKGLLDSQGFIGSSSQGNVKDKKGFFLGFRKGFTVFDLERSLTTYLKALNLVKIFNESSLQVLFVGAPLSLESFIQKELEKTRHVFIREDSWVLGSLTNYVQSGLYPDLIITFNSHNSFASKECFKRGVPLISFVDDSCDIAYIDYPILVNLKSQGVSHMYYNLIKQCSSNNNV
jgi:ribosomal protein S2